MKALRILFTVAVLMLHAWAWMAIWIDGPSAAWAAAALILIHGAVSAGLLMRVPSKGGPVLASAPPSLVVLVW